MATMQPGAKTSRSSPPIPSRTSCLAICLAAFGHAAAQVEPNSPAPADPNAAVLLTTTQPAESATIAGRIVLTNVEKTVLDAVRDRTWQFDETGLYVMLGLAARAPELDLMQWHDLDRPAYANLLADPGRYRAKPLRAKVRVHYVSKLQSGAGLGFREFWPKDRPVWEMDCIWTEEPHEKDKPVRVYSVVDPKPLIGDPDEVGPQNRWRYERGRDIRIAALFYKVLMARQETGRKTRAYPMMMAWQLSRTVPWRSVGQWDSGGLSQLAPILILVIVMVAGFYFTRRRLARLRQADRRTPRRYRPLRYQTDEDASARSAGTSDQDGPDDAPDLPVDPELTSAVEEFLREKEHEDGDGTDHRG